MPVTIHPSMVQPALVHQRNSDPADHAQKVLRVACQKEERDCLELLQSSFGDQIPPGLLPDANGFVSAAIKAYSHHHHLVIRPEDIWTAILVQFSFYVNAHAEELRGQFVAHEGKKELEIVYQFGNRYTVDFGDFAEKMGKLLEKNVVDKDLRKWVMPAFSTTTRHDTVIASIIMMASMQKYFDFTCRILCGLPSVTLLGEKADYEIIYKRLEKLHSWGPETTQFASLLRPVIRRFIASFEQPQADKTTDFWARMFKHHRNFSGPSYFSGWITAFCFWDEDGRAIKWARDLDARDESPSRAGPRPSQPEPIPAHGIHVVRDQLHMDGVRFGHIETDSVPVGFAKVPVKVIDNDVEFATEMIAGSVCINCTSSGAELEGGEVGLDTMQPQTGWWIFEKAEPEKK